MNIAPPGAPLKTLSELYPDARPVASSDRLADARRALALRRDQVGNSDAAGAKGCESPVKSEYTEFPRRCGKCRNCLDYKRFVANRRVELELARGNTVFWGRISFKRDPRALVNEAKSFADVERDLYAQRIAASIARLRKAAGGADLSYVSQGETGGQHGRLHFHVLIVSDRPISQNAVKQAFSGKRKDRPRKADRWLSSKALAQRRARDIARSRLSSPLQIRRAQVAGQQYWQTVKKNGAVSAARGDLRRVASYLSKYLSKDMALPTRRSAGFGTRIVRASFTHDSFAAEYADMKVAGKHWFDYTLHGVQVPWALIKPLVRLFRNGLERRLIDHELRENEEMIREWTQVKAPSWDTRLWAPCPCGMCHKLAAELRDADTGTLLFRPLTVVPVKAPPCSPDRAMQRFKDRANGRRMVGRKAEPIRPARPTYLGRGPDE